MTELITAWVTKYALTDGITKVDGMPSSVSSGMFIYRTSGAYDQYARKNEWHLTEADAISRAEEMRVKKIKTLHKSIAKLEKLRFTP